MTPEDYAAMTDRVYYALRRQKWDENASFKLMQLYFTSGAYKEDRDDFTDDFTDYLTEDEEE